MPLSKGGAQGIRLENKMKQRVFLGGLGGLVMLG